MNKYLIECFEWFDKLNGNSYHSVRINALTNKGEKLIACLPIEYGYGEQYKYTAYNYLIKKGLVKQEDRFNHDLNRTRFIYRKQENCLKRDLYKGLFEDNEQINKLKVVIK
jgi:hypothetical protein